MDACTASEQRPCVKRHDPARRPTDEILFCDRR